jgi:RNA polymerase sigma-70 factor (ECF subfamily)
MGTVDPDYRDPGSLAGQSAVDPDPATMVCPPGLADFAACYERELPGLVWFVMSLGASQDEATEIAQYALAAAFDAWATIRSPRAWLRRVGERAYYRRRSGREVPVEATPDVAARLGVSTVVEFRQQERQVLAALAKLPPKQRQVMERQVMERQVMERQVMAWYMDGYSPSTIAGELGADPAAVRQNLVSTG